MRGPHFFLRFQRPRCAVSLHIGTLMHMALETQIDSDQDSVLVNESTKPHTLSCVDADAKAAHHARWRCEKDVKLHRTCQTSARRADKTSRQNLHTSHDATNTTHQPPKASIATSSHYSGTHVIVQLAQNFSTSTASSSS